MAMTGRTVADGWVLQIVTMGGWSLPAGIQGRESALARLLASADSNGVPLVPVLAASVPDGALLHHALVRVRIPRGSAAERPRAFAVRLAWVAREGDAFIPDEVLEAVDWPAQAERLATPLDEGQRASGPQRAAAVPLG